MPASALRKPIYDSAVRESLERSAATIKLAARQVEKPWGRSDIPAVFAPTGGRRVGEIWFEHSSAEDLPLLVKYIFTSERLSVQVHPDDVQARQRGLRQGKSECWYVLDAEPGASIGIGLRRPLAAAELRAAALDGSIEQHLDWRPVSPGDFFYVPAGTIHALGAGIAVLELQQNSDVTYRLYDYGRPRELHLDDAVGVANLAAGARHSSRTGAGRADTVLHSGCHFSLMRATSTRSLPASLSKHRRWVMPLEGHVHSHGEYARAGECLLLQPGAGLSLSPDSLILVGADGPV